MKTSLLTTSVVKLLSFFASFACLFSCQSVEKKYEQITGQAQGTTFKIVYSKPSQVEITGAVDSIFVAIDESMSLWVESSIISKVNASADSVKVDTHFENVFLKSRELYHQSKGAFDPTVGPLLSAWGLARKKDLPLPTSGQIDSLKLLIGFDQFRLDNHIVYKANPLSEVDFNAIAQGYTVDVLSEFLESRGSTDYLIEVGGELRSKGLNASGASWKVGIEKPDFNSGIETNALQTIINLENAALATSGSYRKFVEVDGRKYSHTIDPKTGRPVEHHMLSVSVIAPTAMEADGYATMFMVLGEKKALKFAEENRLLIQCISEDNGELRVSYSSGFEDIIADL